MHNSIQTPANRTADSHDQAIGRLRHGKCRLDEKFLKTPVRGFRRGRNTIIFYTNGDEQMRSGGTRAWRNNNPGNLENSSFSRRHGSLGDDGRFAIFAAETIGMRALVSLLRGSTFQRLSLEDAMGRFAPKTENNTAAYIRFIARLLNISKTTPLNKLSTGQITGFANAIRRFEGWQQGTISWASAQNP